MNWTKIEEEDKETYAIAVCSAALRDLSEEQQNRVIGYLQERFENNQITLLPIKDEDITKGYDHDSRRSPSILTEKKTYS